MTITQSDILKVDSLEALDFFYDKFSEKCNLYKEQRGEKFNFKIIPNFETLELEVKMEFLEEESDDNTERNPQLN